MNSRRMGPGGAARGDFDTPSWISYFVYVLDGVDVSPRRVKESLEKHPHQIKAGLFHLTLFILRKCR